ncbi:protein IQ-DOMAIN 13-like [Curcuma longa]|uniref:protein IQ-DOMAIN 13-like n=1 Tax=Curcuma longa TaxID=136217 RepID=UPI003D9DB316
MGKKGRWFSAIKRAFTASSKEEAPDPPRGQRVKKRWGFGMSKHGGQISSFIHGEPSSIEKILEDAEGEWRRQRVQTMIELDHARVSAIMIQAAYRGYRARRRYKALRGMMRLQRVVRGQEVKRQMANTMRHMQRLVRVQSQVHAWRSRMAESRRLQLLHAERNLPRQEEAVGGRGGWDDSLLAKEQLEARMRRKVEAVAKRERALAYAYSDHLLEATHESTEATLTGAAPWWWRTWLERQAPPSEPPAAGAPPQRRHSRPKPAEADVASLTSCPPFATPNYMAPTASAKAKARAAPSPQQEPRKKRFSFGLSQSISSLFSSKEAAAAGGGGGTERSGGRQWRHRPTRSVGSVSMDSAMSTPVGAVARRGFVK